MSASQQSSEMDKSSQDFKEELDILEASDILSKSLNRGLRN